VKRVDNDEHVHPLCISKTERKRERERKEIKRKEKKRKEKSNCTSSQNTKYPHTQNKLVER